ncbi:MAG: terminase family protein [Acidobacteriia bacterium]|nr:terminase family protein [Terriglobia bacterium]
MGRSEGIRREIIYDPLPSQKAFHESAARFKGFSGPIGCGKSQALCQEAIRLSYQNAGRPGLLGAPTYPMLRDATQVTLLEILDATGIPYEHNKAENTLTMVDTRSKILFRPLEDFERLRGTNLAWFGVDELTYTQEAAWLRLEGRLRDPKAKRLCGFAAWTPKGYDWVYRRFIANGGEDYRAVIARPFENRHLLARIPDYYERLRKSYDDRFYQQEALGSYLSMDGSRAYAAFERGAHVTELAVNPRRKLYWALDFNVDPMSSVVVQIEDERVLVADEIVIRHGTTQEACEEFLKRYPRHYPGVVIFGDASGYQQQTTGATDYEMVREYFQEHSNLRVEYKAPRSNPPVKLRVNLMNSKLRSAAGDVRMVVDPKCKELIADLEQVVFKAETWQIDKDRDRLRTHTSDALGYLVWQECRPKATVGLGQRRVL